jgi:hypothetical protein
VLAFKEGPTSTQQGAASSQRKGTGSVRERSAGHYELRVYDATTKRQVGRTYVATRAEKGAGIRAARAELAKYRDRADKWAQTTYDRAGNGPCVVVDGAHQPRS